MIGVYKKHWVYWMRLQIYLRIIVLLGLYKIYPMFMQHHFYDNAPVTIYRYWSDDPDGQDMLRLDW